MVYDFVFTKTEMRKSEFFQWLINTMIDAGWALESQGRTNVDHYCMYSTGESGNDKIGVHIREWYYNANYNFTTTNYGMISARPYHTYIPNPNLVGAGTLKPNEAWVEFRVTNDFQPSEILNIYHHINKDRIIVATENKYHTSTPSATFFVLGKPATLAQTDEFNKSAVICSHGNYMCRSGVINYNTEVLHHSSIFHFPLLPKGHFNSKQTATDILLTNTIEGIKHRVENIFYTNFDYSPIKVYTHDMLKNTFTDNNGRKYKLFTHNLTSSLTNSYLRNFMIRVE